MKEDYISEHSSVVPLSFLNHLDNLLLKFKENKPYFIPKPTKFFIFFLKSHHLLLDIRDNFADEQSKQLFDRLLLNFLAAPFLSDPYIHFPIFDTKKWNSFLNQAERLTQYAANDYILDRVETWILEGYSYRDICTAKNGDIVIDAGSFTGNTSLYFSNLVGNNGKVICFEPDPTNFMYLDTNIKKSNRTNILPINAALNSCTQLINFNTMDNGNKAGARIDTAGIAEIQAYSIDDFVNDNRIKKINFIKMDIEGAELDAIEGAKHTIQCMHPRMAICVYHKPDDMVSIPHAVLSLNPNYKLYLKHNSPKRIETVMFFEPTNEPTILSKMTRFIPDESINLYKNSLEALRALALRSLFNSIVSSFKTYSIIPLVFQETYSVPYIFAPFSDHVLDHYEIAVTYDEIIVALHIEKTMRYNAEQIERIKAWLSSLTNSVISLELIEENQRIGCQFRISQNESINMAPTVSKFLHLLISSTLPKLWEFSMLSNELRYFYMSCKETPLKLTN